MHIFLMLHLEVGGGGHAMPHCDTVQWCLEIRVSLPTTFSKYELWFGHFCLVVCFALICEQKK